VINPGSGQLSYYFRIQPFQFDAGVGRGKLPIQRYTFFHGRPPCQKGKEKVVIFFLLSASWLHTLNNYFN